MATCTLLATVGPSSHSRQPSLYFLVNWFEVGQLSTVHESKSISSKPMSLWFTVHRFCQQKSNIVLVLWIVRGHQVYFHSVFYFSIVYGDITCPRVPNRQRSLWFFVDQVCRLTLPLSTEPGQLLPTFEFMTAAAFEARSCPTWQNEIKKTNLYTYTSPAAGINFLLWPRAGFNFLQLFI